MATKVKKKSTATTGSSKKSAKRNLTSDPPIIVGGGGSVLVLIRSNATQITPSPRPGYLCFRLGSNIKTVQFFDGVTPGTTPLSVKDTKRHFTQFDE